MYDAREKALRDRKWEIAAAERKGEAKGEVEGEIKGEIKGEIRMIRTLQDWLACLSRTRRNCAR